MFINAMEKVDNNSTVIEQLAHNPAETTEETVFSLFIKPHNESLLKKRDLLDDQIKVWKMEMKTYEVSTNEYNELEKKIEDSKEKLEKIERKMAYLRDLCDKHREKFKKLEDNLASIDPMVEPAYNVQSLIEEMSFLILIEPNYKSLLKKRDLLDDQIKVWKMEMEKYNASNNEYHELKKKIEDSKEKLEKMERKIIYLRDLCNKYRSKYMSPELYKVLLNKNIALDTLKNFDLIYYGLIEDYEQSIGDFKSQSSFDEIYKFKLLKYKLMENFLALIESNLNNNKLLNNIINNAFQLFYHKHKSNNNYDPKYINRFAIALLDYLNENNIYNDKLYNIIASNISNIVRINGKSSNSYYEVSNDNKYMANDVKLYYNNYQKSYYNYRIIVTNQIKEIYAEIYCSNYSIKIQESIQAIFLKNNIDLNAFRKNTKINNKLFKENFLKNSTELYDDEYYDRILCLNIDLLNFFTENNINENEINNIMKKNMDKINLEYPRYSEEFKNTQSNYEKMISKNNKQNNNI